MRYIKMPAGGTLSQVAHEANIPIDAILQANPGLDPRHIPVGQTITIPGTKDTPPTSAETYKKRIRETSQNKPDKKVTNKPEKNCKCLPPPWMKIAINEMNKHVQRYINQGKSGDNPIIMKYHHSSKLNKYVEAKKYHEGQSWCGTFINYVLKQLKYTTFNTTFRARDWAKYGKRVPMPIYGAIGVKTRRGGGHVSFVMGVDDVKNPKYVYMLGGNQWGKPNDIDWGVKTTRRLKKGNKTIPYIKSVLFPSRYKISDWDLGFRVPKDYNTTECKLKKYTGRFIIALSDGA